MDSEIDFLNVAWYYDWSSHIVTSPPSSFSLKLMANGISYVPMVWGEAAITNSSEISSLSQLNIPGVDNYLLGYNEPNLSGQSNLQVDTAIKYWPVAVSTGRTLVSPAMPQGDSAFNWLTNFVQKAQANNIPTFSYVAIHCYGVPDSAAFLSNIRKYYNAFHLPIWITEFAVKSNGTTSDVETFMKMVIPALEAMPYVKRYAWFSFSQTDPDPSKRISALYGNGQLTDLGKLYAAY